MVQENTSRGNRAIVVDQTISLGLLTLIGFGVGLSAFFFGFYETAVWQPMLLAGLVLLLACVVAKPAVPTGSAAVASAGLFGLGFWSLASTGWAEASDLAVTDGARWLLYGVLLLLLIYLLREDSSRRWLMGATTAGVIAMSLYLEFRLLTDDTAVADLFVANRLNSPLNYINGVATYLLAGVWPLIAVAERSRNYFLRSLASFAAVQLVVLAVLTQSRGAIVAIIASTLLVFVVVPGRITRGWLIVAVAIGVALCTPALLDVVDAGDQELATSAVRNVVEMGLLGGLVSALLVTAGSWVSAAAQRGSSETEYTVRVVSGVGLMALCVLAVGALAVAAGSRSDQIRDQIDSFTQLEETDGGSRLTSGGGNRYDYWRVAVRQFEDDPITGVGAGNYRKTYYLERSTSEDIQQAHSIQLQVLGELGLVGFAGLAAFVGAVLFGFWATGQGASSRIADPALAVSAGGTFLIWLFHTSVDWMHLLPGLTGIAICAAAVLLPPLRPVADRSQGPVIVVVAAAVLLTSVPVLRQFRAQQLEDQAAQKLDSDPVQALGAARDSLNLEPSQRSFYLESAAFARLGLYEESRDVLLAATKSNPHDFVAWALLGDLATRRGLDGEARRYYRRALQLNPRDPGLVALAGASADDP